MRYEAPGSVEEAVAILADANGAARILAGGTDLLVQLRAGMISPEVVVNIKNIAETQGHHPDIIFGWGYATIKIFTHKIKGLVESDFILAAKIDKINL